MADTMQWKRDEDYVEIALGLDTDLGAIWFVESNLELISLPVEFRSRVPQLDNVGLDRLKTAITKWADREGFKLA